MSRLKIDHVAGARQNGSRGLPASWRLGTYQAMLRLCQTLLLLTCSGGGYLAKRSTKPHHPHTAVAEHANICVQ
jgi:hypothetical protein